MSSTVVVVVEVDGPGIDAAQRIDLSRLLQQELDGIDGARTEQSQSGPPPTGAKAGEALTAGALVLALAPEVYTHVVQLVTGWLRRQRVGIKVTIDDQTLEGDVTRAQRDALVEAFLARTATEPPKE